MVGYDIRTDPFAPPVFHDVNFAITSAVIDGQVAGSRFKVRSMVNGEQVKPGASPEFLLILA